jgi:cysteinyl-tRNA synthetase
MDPKNIYLHNTLSGKKELFKPIKPGVVGMYHCGPTVYDAAHIGNFRTFVMSDILRRVFEYNDYAVTQVMNITDVDDKTIRRAREEKKSLTDLTRHYEKVFLDNLHSLNILTPTKLLRATENIDGMISLVQKLLEKDFAYKTDDGIYMSIEKVKGYGELARLDLATEKKSRIASDEYDKESPQDFALWKFKKPDDGENHWSAPFGDGRPGWHIECSAMAMEALGSTIDIHTGGTDLIFPHHTNEIAQSESATGKKFAHYWLHGGFMNVKDEKMSKSKGNFLKLADLENASISPLAFRYWLLTAHYRSLVNFSLEAVSGAQNAYIRLVEAFMGWKSDVPGSIDVDFQGKFKAAINDDLNMPEAIALAWQLVKDHHMSPADKRATMLDFDRVFGLGLAAVDTMDDSPVSIESLPPEIFALSEARQDARTEKDWQKADALRVEIESRGYSVKDTDDGAIIKKVK